jgi:hypothetical protein
LIAETIVLTQHLKKMNDGWSFTFVAMLLVIVNHMLRLKSCLQHKHGSVLCAQICSRLAAVILGAPNNHLHN